MSEEHALTRAQRLRRELRNYALISAYLYVCFGVLLMYEASVLESRDVSFVPWGIALVKALVLGKFILIGEALSVGERAQGHPLLYRIAWKSLAFLGVLLVLKALEELILGWFHGHTLAQVAEEVLARTWIENLAPVFIMLLVLVPMVCVSELYRTIGREGFRKLLLDR